MKWWNESKFWVFDPDKTFLCYRGCLNSNCCMTKKAQKNFVMGLKRLWSWGSGFFFTKSLYVGRFSISMQNFSICGAGCSFWVKKTTIFRYYLENEGVASGHQAPSVSTESTSLQWFELLPHSLGGGGIKKNSLPTLTDRHTMYTRWKGLQKKLLRFNIVCWKTCPHLVDQWTYSLSIQYITASVAKCPLLFLLGIWWVFSI